MLRKLSLALLLLSGIITALYLMPLSPPLMADMLSDEAAYFFQDEEDWLRESSLLEIFWVKLLEFKARRELKAQLSMQLSLSPDEPAKTIHTATHAVRGLYINQTQEEVPIISNSTLASFVRGFGYCDHVNGFLAFLLTDFLDKVQLWGLRNEHGISTHALVRSESSLGVVWTDAFYCMNPYGFEGEFTEKSNSYISPYEQSAGNLYSPSYYEKSFFINEYTYTHTAGKVMARLRPLLPSTEPARPGKEAAVKTASIMIAKNRGQQMEWLQDLHKASPGQKKLFLQARILHIYGRHAEALSLYRQVIALNARGRLAKYAAVFAQRISAGNQPCI